MTAIFTVPPLSSFFEKITKDGLDRLAVGRIGFVECHHINKYDMSLMHEKVAEKIERLCFADFLRCLDPFQHCLATAGDNRAVLHIISMKHRIITG